MTRFNISGDAVSEKYGGSWGVYVETRWEDRWRTWHGGGSSRTENNRKENLNISYIYSLILWFPWIGFSRFLACRFIYFHPQYFRISETIPQSSTCGFRDIMMWPFFGHRTCSQARLLQLTFKVNFTRFKFSPSVSQYSETPSFHTDRKL